MATATTTTSPTTATPTITSMLSSSSSHPLKSQHKRNALKDLTALRLWYLFYFGAQFTQLFLPLVLDTIMGLSSSTIGILMSLRRFTIFLIAPIFSVLCDATLQHRLLLLLALGSYYFCTFVLTHTRAMWAIVFVIVVREACVAGCEPAVNTAAFAKLAAIYNDREGEVEEEGSRNEMMTSKFGSLRLFGSLGWGFASLIVPVVCERYFHNSLLPVLYAQIILGVPVLLLVAGGLDLSPGLFQQARNLKAATPAPGDEEQGVQQQQRAWDADNNNNAHPNYSSVSSDSTTTMTNNSSTDSTVPQSCRKNQVVTPCAAQTERRVQQHPASPLRERVQQKNTKTVIAKASDKTPLLLHHEQNHHHQQQQQQDHKQTPPPTRPIPSPTSSTTSSTTTSHHSTFASPSSSTSSSTTTRERIALLCVLAAFEQGVVIGTTQTTLQLHYSTIGISVSIIGLSILFGCLSECLMFLLDAPLRRHFHSVTIDKRFIQYGIFTRTLAMLAYILIGRLPAEWGTGRAVLVIATEMMCGGSFALFVSSVLQITNRVAPGRWQTGGQGIVTSVLFGVGPAAGALMSGWLYQQVGTQWLYGGTAMWNMAVVFVLETYM